MHVCDVLDSCYSLCLSKAYFRFFFSSLWSICFVVGAVVVLLLSHWLFPLLPPLHLSLSLSHVCVIKNALKNDVHHSYTFNQIHDLYTALVYARSFICPLCISLSLSLSPSKYFFSGFFSFHFTLRTLSRIRKRVPCWKNKQTLFSIHYDYIEVADFRAPFFTQI